MGTGKWTLLLPLWSVKVQNHLGLERFIVTPLGASVG